jgi:VanZ family protein
MTTRDLPHQQACAQWSNRILVLSLLGIAYLTLFPFKSPFVAIYDLQRSPFLLGMSSKQPRYLDFFLNVLLFVPFGFGLCAQVRKRCGSQWSALLLTLTLGASVSYVVEFLQLYIPGRDSGWGDVISNTTGSVAGFFLFELCGGAVLEGLSKCEDLFVAWLSPRRAVLLLVAYFAVCFGVSAIWQNQTRLSNWDPESSLFVGNDASGRFPWMGHVLRLQIWDRALPEEAVRRITAGGPADDESAGLLGSYDFAGAAPYQDRTHFLPALVRTPQQSHFTNAGSLELDARSWLRTELPVDTLTRAIQKSSQFTVHIVCVPSATQVASGRIVSLSQSADNVNFHLRENGGDLVFWFRNPLSEARSDLAWRVPDVVESGKTLDIVASYDGSDAFLYVDGNPVSETYHLGPGTSLMRQFFWVAATDLEGYVIVYETLIFLPAGMLIGLAAKKWPTGEIHCRWILAVAFVIPAVLLEVLLAGMSGRRISLGNIALSIVFGLAGALLINADRRSTKSLGAS